MLPLFLNLAIFLVSRVYSATESKCCCGCPLNPCPLNLKAECPDPTASCGSSRSPSSLPMVDCRELLNATNYFTPVEQDYDFVPIGKDSQDVPATTRSTTPARFFFKAKHRITHKPKTTVKPAADFPAPTMPPPPPNPMFFNPVQQPNGAAVALTNFQPPMMGREFVPIPVTTLPIVMRNPPVQPPLNPPVQPPLLIPSMQPSLSSGPRYQLMSTHVRVPQYDYGNNLSSFVGRVLNGVENLVGSTLRALNPFPQVVVYRMTT